MVTSNDRNNKPANPKQNKKVKVVETCGVDKKSMGMFYLRNADARAVDIFPQDMAEKICVDFTCKGKECTREPCSFKHPRNPRDMDRVTVEAITKNFATTKQRWLSNFHFQHETTLSAETKAMMGGSQGPTQQ